MYFLDLLGTLAFAVAGAFKAKGRELNIFGVVFLGIITAVGGGTFRDLIIGRTPLFYLQDPNYLLVAVFAGIATYLVPHIFKKGFSFFRFLDSLGLSTFVIIGTSITYGHVFREGEKGAIVFLASVFMGMVTGFGGGVIRDAVMGDVPFAFKQGSAYIAASFLGAVSFFALMFWSVPAAVSVSMAITLIFREIISEYGIYKKIIKARI